MYIINIIVLTIGNLSHHNLYKKEILDSGIYIYWQITINKKIIKGVVELLLNLLSSTNISIQEKTIWTLSILSMNNAEFSHKILEYEKSKYQFEILMKLLFIKNDEIKEQVLFF